MKKNTKQILDNILNDIRHDEPDAAELKAAAERVWARVANEDNVMAVTQTAQAEHLRDCHDFQTLIPAYLSGQLTAARVLLFEDHTGECFACRKELKAARTANAKPVVAEVVPPKTSWFSFKQPAFRFAFAAVLVIGLGLGSWPILEQIINSFKVFNAVIAASSGEIYRIDDKQNQLVRTGDKINRGERLRTAKGATAVVKLPDGTLVEVAERSEFSLSETPEGATINLNQGNVIVQAAKQKDKHLYVKTEDALVSVVGTIFSVNNGTKGSRVSVVEGEVHVEHDGKDSKLLPGDQVTTSPSIEPRPIQDEVAWSRNADRYKQLLAEVAKLRNDIAALPRPGVRHSTRLLDVMPAGTVFYVALPNLTETLNASYDLVKQRIAQNPELNTWMNQRQTEDDRAFGFADKAFAQLRTLGSNLGEEITMSFELNAKGSPAEPLFVADLNNSNGLRTAIEQTSAKQVQIIDDPTAAVQEAAGKELFVLLSDHMLVASPKLETLQRFAVSSKAESSFKDSSFYAAIAKRYYEGTSVIVAADLEKITPQMAKASADRETKVVTDQLGLTNFKHLIGEIKDGKGQAQNSAELTFNEPNKGIASWLSAPAPMGALNFISPDATIVGSLVIKDPTAMADNLLTALKVAEPKFGDELARFEATHGISLRNDIAAPLGGEFAFALDGPLVPIPSWKVIVEVYDQSRMQQTLERIVSELNRLAQQNSKQGFALTSSELNGQLVSTIKSLDYPVEINYAFVRGYMIVAPTKALIDRAIRYAESGSTLLQSPRFMASLPADRQANFSAMLYQNLSPVVAPLARNLGNVTANGKGRGAGDMAAMTTLVNQAPSLAYVYAYEDRLRMSVNTDKGALNLGDLIGLPGSMMMQGIIKDAMKQ